MANWDIFHSGSLEVERNLSPEVVRDGVNRGAIVATDLTRPAGSGEPWVRLSDHPRLASLFKGGSIAPDKPAAPPKGKATPKPPVADSSSLRSILDDDSDDGSIDSFDEDDLDFGPSPRRPLHEGAELIPGTPTLPSGVNKGTTEDLDPTGFPDSYDRDLDLSLREPRHVVSLDGEDEDEYDPEAEDEEAAEFTFSRGGAETVEELDLAAMVDVAFQLVLFFLVTASTVVFKTLEVPKPKPPDNKGAAVQSMGRTMQELKEDYILVEIDANNEVKIDHEKSPNDFNGLVNRLREVRTATSRNAMLVTADAATLHKNVVTAYDAANEIGLGIAIATPKATPDKAPVPPPAPPAIPPGQ